MKRLHVNITFNFIQIFILELESQLFGFNPLVVRDVYTFVFITKRYIRRILSVTASVA